jgi:hypothetical protein
VGPVCRCPTDRYTFLWVLTEASRLRGGLQARLGGSGLEPARAARGPAGHGRTKPRRRRTTVLLNASLTAT